MSTNSKMNNQLLYNLIFNCLEQENHELIELTEEGIFFAPELYIAFVLGKVIKKNFKDVFLSNNVVVWGRETVIEKSLGPIDIVFEIEENKSVLMELKLRDTIHAYALDIEKLKAQPIAHTKYFIALVDGWESENIEDPRIIGLEERYSELNRIAEFKSFKTKNKRYVKPIICTVAVWSISV
jgi:hypothetical protein